MVAGLLPSLIPTDTSAAVGEEPGNVQPTAPTIAKATPLPPDEPEKAALIFVIVEEMPRFPGCEVRDLAKKERYECATNLMLKFIYDHIRYPEIARQNGIEGTAYIKFVVETDGAISQATIVRDIGGGCGAEALRVVGLMPKWLPGFQRGKAVRVQFNLPVKFKLGS